MTSLDRKGFLARTGLALASAGLLAPLLEDDAEATDAALRDWRSVRAQFPLSREWLHFGGLLLASHPTPVRRAIERHRRGLDANPVHYLQVHGTGAEARVLRAAAAYLGARPTDIALTDSTTMGLGLLYNGLRLRARDEVLTTHHDFFATHEALRQNTSRSGASLRIVSLYDRSEAASDEQIVARLRAAVTPRTRVVAVTWVHSSTGVKLPIRRIADALAAVNRNRRPADRVLLCVDGVHGLGVEDATVGSLGCDFFVAGTHKWLFGPRGTGLVWGHSQAWDAVTPTIPSFSRAGTPAAAFTPGGFHSFEHRWALDEAFAFHRRIGKRRVAARIHALNTRLKNGLASMSHVRLYTPRSARLSAGLVVFDVRGLSPETVVRRLRERRIIATETPYSPSHARLATGLLNTPAEVDAVLRAIRSLR